MTDYIDNTIRKATRSHRRVIGKERIYVEDYSQVPEGASLQEGPQGGLYYETEVVEDFEQAMANMREKVFEQYDWSDEQVSAMENHVNRFEEIKGESWERIMNAGRSVGAKGGSYRIKGVGSALEKVHERSKTNDEGEEVYQEPEDLTDIFASTLHSEADTRESVQETTDAIKAEFGEENILAEKRYLDRDANAPYYRANHLIVELDDGLPAEIQVKGKGMEEVGKVGHTATYKDKLNLSDDEKQMVSDCLTQLVEATMGEGEEPDCDPVAEHIIHEVYQHGDEAEV